jgi:hypothetical protein
VSNAFSIATGCIMIFRAFNAGSDKTRMRVRVDWEVALGLEELVEAIDIDCFERLAVCSRKARNLLGTLGDINGKSGKFLVGQAMSYYVIDVSARETSHSLSPCQLLQKSQSWREIRCFSAH